MKKLKSRDWPGVVLTRYIVDNTRIILAELIGRDYLVEMVVGHLKNGYSILFRGEGDDKTAVTLRMDLDARQGKAGSKVSVAKTSKGVAVATIQSGAGKIFTLPPGRKFLEELSKSSDIPIAEEWADDVFMFLQKRNIVISLRSTEGAVGYIADRNRLTQALTEFVETKAKPFDKTLPDEEIPDTVSAFVRQYSDKLSEMLFEKTKTVYDGTRPEDKVDFSLIYQNGFTKYAPQADVVNACLKKLETKRSAWLGAEMGTGKTLMGIMSAYGLYKKTGKGQRVLIMAPPHLVRKWTRETKKALGDICSKVEVIRKKSDADRLVLPYAKIRPEGVEVYIVPREMAALGHYWRGLKPLTVMKEVKVGKQVMKMPVPKTDEKGRFIVRCPECGKEVPVLRTRRTFCEEEVQKHLHFITGTDPIEPGRLKTIGIGNPDKEPCGAILWQAVETEGSRGTTAQVSRVPVMWYLKKVMPRGWFDLFILDEAHEEKGDSARGMASAHAARLSKKTLLLTGTLSGGKPSTIFYLLWRFAPEVMKSIGIPYSGETQFSEKYGVVERTSFAVADDTDRKSTRGKANRGGKPKEKPGVSPELLLKILPFTSFLKLSDLRADLPEYREIITEVGMNPEHMDEYVRLRDEVFNMGKKDSYSGTAKAISVLMSYIDNPAAEEITKFDKKLKKEVVLGRAKGLDVVTGKEEELANIIIANKVEGRKTIVFVEYTDKRDVQPRLASVLERFGIKAAVLTSKVKAEKREEWIEQNTAEADCLICNPRLVMTGLDLLDFPTVVFFQTPFSPYILRQASRRPWRMGQTRKVDVHFLVAEGTLQPAAMKIVANRMTASKIFEGEIPEEAGLATISDIEEKSFVMELAESIGDKDKRGSLELLWKEKMREEIHQDDLLFAPPVQPEPEVVETTATVVQEKVAEMSSNRGGKETFVFKKVSKVELYDDRAASFVIDGQTYLLKDGWVFAVSGIPGDRAKRSVGKYVQKKSKKSGKNYIEAKLNDGKVIYVGKQASTGEFVALRRVAKEAV